MSTNTKHLRDIADRDSLTQDLRDEVWVACDEIDWLRETVKPINSESLTWPCVFAFAKEMEQKLSLNRHKGDRAGWLKLDLAALESRLEEEVKELEDTLLYREPNDYVLSEAADVANFAMMIADKCCDLLRWKQQQPTPETHMQTPMEQEQNKANTPGSVTLRVDRLGGLLRELEQISESLAERLESILIALPVNPALKNENVPPTPGPSLTRAIGSHCDTLDNIISNLKHTLDRIDL